MSHIWVVEEYLDGKYTWQVDEQSNISLTRKAAQRDMENIKDISPKGIKFRIRKYIRA